MVSYISLRRAIYYWLCSWYLWKIIFVLQEKTRDDSRDYEIKKKDSFVAGPIKACARFVGRICFVGKLGQT